MHLTADVNLVLKSTIRSYRKNLFHNFEKRADIFTSSFTYQSIVFRNALNLMCMGVLCCVNFEDFVRTPRTLGEQ